MPFPKRLPPAQASWSEAVHLFRSKCIVFITLSSPISIVVVVSANRHKQQNRAPQILTSAFSDAKCGDHPFIRFGWKPRCSTEIVNITKWSCPWISVIKIKAQRNVFLFTKRLPCESKLAVPLPRTNFVKILKNCFSCTGVVRNWCGVADLSNSSKNKLSLV